jgi:hypothetical protein
MPDSYGNLTADDNEKVQRWWVQHWKAPVICPVCKTTEWVQASHVVNVVRHASDAYAPNTVSYT